MYYILLNNELTNDAQGKPINYASKEDALAAISYFDIAKGEKYTVVHYMDYYEMLYNKEAVA